MQEFARLERQIRMEVGECTPSPQVSVVNDSGQHPAEGAPVSRSREDMLLLQAARVGGGSDGQMKQDTQMKQHRTVRFAETESHSMQEPQEADPHQRQV